MSIEEKHALQDIARLLTYAGKGLHDAIDNENMNERTSLELALINLGSVAEEHGLGEDVARWVRNGVNNERKRNIHTRKHFRKEQA